MKIVFILPQRDKKPIGGFKIVYEYANRLSDRGHEVTIAYYCGNDLKRTKLPLQARNMLCRISVRHRPKWFNLNGNVKKIVIPKIENTYLPDADIIFATAVGTVDAVHTLDEAKGKKYYLIQGYEVWDKTDAEVRKTYLYKDMRKICIASWLAEYMKGEPVEVIPNPIDTQEFFIEKSIEKRNPYTISLLYHTAEYKGVNYALRALYILKSKYPQLSVWMFGVSNRPESIPKWIRYTRNAKSSELRTIYNNSAIFLCATIEEGFGLTGAEAMACGCALVSTEYKGVKEYAIDGENALLSPVKDIQALAKNVESLFQDNNLRIQLAQNGYKKIRKNSWKEAVDKMEKLFMEKN
ncbi:MAG: glycosyltransferase family 4 protein [Butyrivibrio sp.]|nr:glycosyltransferase family 4 protein [Butyrivibrio sp.]